MTESLHLDRSDGNSGGAIDSRDQRDKPQDRRGKPWVHHIPDDAIDARKTHCKRNGKPINPNQRLMLLILDGICRERCFCWVGDSELVEKYGRCRSAVQDLLQGMEADGLIHRVSPSKGHRGRLGIILLKRLNPDLPVADPSEIDAVIADMPRIITEVRRGMKRHTKEEVTCPENRTRSCPENRARDMSGKPGAEELRIPEERRISVVPKMIGTLKD